MPIGDSITDIVCWRAYLWEKLQNTGYANINFVGSNRGESPSGCNVLSYDKDSEGHSGYLATHIAALNMLPGWLEQNPADVVTIHLGSNDISYGYTSGAILDAFTKLVEQLRESNTAIKIIVRLTERYTPSSKADSSLGRSNHSDSHWCTGEDCS
jgi:lysophospholipase L1-like esterase